MTLPDATPNPCNDCPWRRTSTRGWLGPFSASDWVSLAQSDMPVACHLTIDRDDDWEQPGVKQCRGVAMFRKNICKAPRDPAVVVGPRDTEKVFGRGTEFMDHHDNTPLANFLAGQH